MLRPSPCLLIALLLVPMLVSVGCKENLDPATPEGAMHRLRDALLAKDPAALLAASSQKTRDDLAALHALLSKQMQTIEARYTADQKAAALTVYDAAIASAKTPEDLFAALVRPRLEALGSPEGLRYGLSVADEPTVNGDRATVRTVSGEHVDFVLEEGTWKVAEFERVISQNLTQVDLNRQLLEKNLVAVEQIRKQAAAKAAREQARGPLEEGQTGPGAAPAQSP